jgi:hypothetical protein
MEGNIEMGLGRIGFKRRGVHSQAQDRNRWRAPVNMIIILKYPYKASNI